MQKIICTGRITQDLELRYSNDNKPILSIPVAVINSSKDAKPLYINFITYGDIAKAHHQYLTKGSTISVEGHIYQSTKEEDGKNKRYYNFYADKIEYINIKRENKTPGDEVLESVVNNTTKPEEDPFAVFGEEVVINSDDLPF